MTAFDLFSIGHSNIPADRFIAMQRAADVSVIADVRSTAAPETPDELPAGDAERETD